jgi:hypothetical protein
VNGIMPVIAYYTGAAAAMSLWKFVPIGFGLVGAAVTFVRRRSLLDTVLAAAFPMVVFFLPAAPTLVTSQSPYAWRVSTPTAWALALSLVPLLLQIGRIRILPVLVAAALMIAPSHYESQMRVVGVERDSRLLEQIGNSWAAAGVPRERITVAYVGPRGGFAREKQDIGPHDLTWGYERVTPAVWSAFNNGWIAQHYIEDYRHLGFRQCGDARPDDLSCREPESACAARRGQRSPWLQTIQLNEPGVSAVCVW